MYIGAVHVYGSDDEHSKITQPFLDQVQRKKLAQELADIVDDEFTRLQEYANSYISDLAAQRAEDFLEKVFQGDADAVMALLGDRTGGGRIRLGGCDAGTPWASLIHGKLFETNVVKLRRQLVETHADLITSERIADLEATVEGLSQQIRKLEYDNEELRRRL